MSLFRRRRQPARESGPPTEAELAWIRETARHTLASAGMEVTFADDGAVLIGDGHHYGLDNLVAKCADAPRELWSEVIEDHFGRVLRARSEAPVDELDQDDLDLRLRTRLMPMEALANAPTAFLDYARPVADDLATVLCVDYPETISFVGAEQAETMDLGRGFALGQRNVDAEPIDDVATFAEGRLTAVGGGSLFIATKVLNMAALTQSIFGGPAPYGVLLGLPGRNQVFLHRISDTALLPAISDLAPLTAQQYAAAVGPVSPNMYFWSATTGEFTRISDCDQTTRDIQITPGPELEALITRFTD